MALVEGMKEEVQQLGFTWENMGRNKIAVQGIPVDGTQENAQYLLKNYLSNTRIMQKLKPVIAINTELLLKA